MINQILLITSLLIIIVNIIIAIDFIKNSSWIFYIILHKADLVKGIREIEIYDDWRE